VPVRITHRADARACPPEPNDARWLAAELPDAFGDVDADMRRAAPAVSKAIDVVAGRKGHSFFGFFLFSLVFFPAALIVAYLVQDRTRPAIA